MRPIKTVSENGNVPRLREYEMSGGASKRGGIPHMTTYTMEMLLMEASEILAEWESRHATWTSQNASRDDLSWLVAADASCALVEWGEYANSDLDLRTASYLRWIKKVEPYKLAHTDVGCNQANDNDWKNYLCIPP